MHSLSALFSRWLSLCLLPVATALYAAPEPSGEQGPVTLGHHAGEVHAGVLADGRGLVVWLECMQPSACVVRMAEEQRGGGQWEIGAASAALAGGAQQPRVATGPGGLAVVTWRQLEGEQGRVFASVRNQDGAWTHPGQAAALSFPPDAYEPEVAIGSDGEVLLVWNQRTENHLGVALARSAPGAAGFQRPSDAHDVLSPPIEFSNSPEVAVSTRGEALIAWYQSARGPLNAYVSQRRSGDSVFSRPAGGEQLSANLAAPEGMGGHFLRDTTPAIDGRGRAAVAWTQPVSPREVSVFVACREPDGSWQAPVRAGRRRGRSATVRVACCPRLAAGTAGDLHLIWTETWDGRSAVFRAHRDASGRWTVPLNGPRVLSQGRHRTGPPALATSGSGRVVAAWSEHSSNGSRMVFSQSRPGRRAWTRAEPLDEGPRGSISSASVASGGPGDRVLTAWIRAGAARVRWLDEERPDGTRE